MPGQHHRTLLLCFVLVGSYLVMQTAVVILHEHVHSGLAWLLGYTSTPFTVVWGNPITVQGWDEGVPYDKLFPRPGDFAEAAIGGGPLLMHLAFVVACLYLLQRPFLIQRAIAFICIYSLLVVNLAELIAYILMRPFIPTGDTGRFAEGTGLSPWVLFISGAVFLVIALSLFAKRIVPRLDAVMANGRLAHWAVVSATAFILFLWGSGLRIIALYPDPQWKVGLVGVVGFGGWLLLTGFKRRDGRS